MKENVEKRTFCSKQTKGDGRIPKDADVPRKGYGPKSEQDKLQKKKR